MLKEVIFLYEEHHDLLPLEYNATQPDRREAVTSSLISPDEQLIHPQLTCCSMQVVSPGRCTKVYFCYTGPSLVPIVPWANWGKNIISLDFALPSFRKEP